MRTTLLSTGTAVLLAAGLSLAAPAAAAPTVPSYAATTDPLLAAAGWLSTQFVDGSHLPTPDGDHFDDKYGATYYANYGVNADVVFGLAAAKTAAPVAARALDYLGTNLDAYADLGGAQGGPYDGSLAKVALAAVVQGEDPTAFPTPDGPVDLIATLRTDECAAGSTTCTPGAASGIYASISEAFVLLAQARGGRGAAPSAAAVDYFLSLQCDEGGFTEGTVACGAKAEDDIDSTSYAIMALTAVGGHAAEVARAADWLAKQQQPGGYWIAQKIPNTNSTGLAAAALQGAGRDVSKARTWLRDQQVPAGTRGAGALRYDGRLTASTTSATSPSVTATAQGLIGLVDGGGLATVSAAGSDDALHLFAPSATASPSVRIGTRHRVTGTGFVAGERVRVEVRSAPVTVATVTAGPDGVAAARFALPASIAAGTHTLALTGLTSRLTATRALTVLAAPASGGGEGSGAPTTGPTPGTPDAPVAAGPNSGGTIAATGLDGSRVAVESVLGGLLVLLGGALTLAGRRRRAA